MKVVNEAWRDAIIEERDKEIQRLREVLKVIAGKEGESISAGGHGFCRLIAKQALEQE
jgi:hypothetical protein